MPRHLISDAHEWINEIPTVPKYTKLDLYDQVKTLTNSTDVEVVAIVISYRGVIEPRSALFLKQIGVNMSDLKLVTVRTLERTIVVWKNHYRSTIQRWDVVAPNDWAATIIKTHSRREVENMFKGYYLPFL